MSRGRLLLLLVMGALVGAFFALDLDAYLSLSRLQAHQEQASAWVQAHFGQAALLFTLLYVVTTALSLPGASLLTLGAAPCSASVGGYCWSPLPAPWAPPWPFSAPASCCATG